MLFSSDLANARFGTNVFMFKVNELSRVKKQSIMMGVDIMSVLFAIWIAYSLRLDRLYSFDTGQLLTVLLFAVVVIIPVFSILGLYKIIVHYTSIKALTSIFRGVTLGIIIWGGLAISFSFDMPRTVPIIVWLTLLILVSGSRVLAKNFFAKAQAREVKDIGLKHVLIYGAGYAGVQLAGALEYEDRISVVGFIDDDETLQGTSISDIKIYNFQSIKGEFTKFSNKKIKIDEVLVAIPSISRSCRAELIDKLKPFPVQVRTLPGLFDLAQGKINIDDVREINISDLLGRDAVNPDKTLLDANIKSKVVMVTGAGGSIGSKLCWQIASLKPRKIILFEQSELALYQIEKKLLHFLAGIKQEYIDIVPVLGSVVNQRRVERACHTFGVETIYHAAAYKHVPMVEKNISEGIENNIFGTYHCAQAAINSGVETFVLISTDKAVRPTNTMGATKRFAELILQGFARSRKQHNTRFTMVRFGNVLGSSGSVVPLFKEQIRQGGAVTVTDPNIIRYFMTIEEAAQLVIQAGAMGKGGDVFVLDMGDPVRIVDLARNMIEFSGLKVRDQSNPQGDIEIHFTGLRPGEKLYEELLIGDNVSKTRHQRIMRAEEEVLSWSVIESVLSALRKELSEGNETMLRAILQNKIKGFEPQCEVVDMLA
jgi:FlaA1/EpsC-like NDP-sugar epimerase